MPEAYRVIEQTRKDEEWSAYVPSLKRQLYCGRNGNRADADDPLLKTDGPGQA